MSKSLYEIQDELQQIIDNIEENGGEVDEFTEEALKIKQEEFESKIESYCNAITILKSEAECCKNEKQRINNIQTTKKNIIEKLRDRILDAVLTWGTPGKNGNKVLNLATRKLFTKLTPTFVPNEDRIATLSIYFKSYVLELKRNGILVTGQDIDLKGMMAAINALVRTEKGENYPPFTVNDLNYIEYEFSGRYSLNQMFDGSHDFLFDMINSPNVSISTETNDKDAKQSIITAAELGIEPTCTLGHIEDKPSLTIK